MYRPCILERKNEQAAPWLNTKDVEKLREELEAMTDKELREEALRIAKLLREKSEH